jgi:molybdate transport system substrate-binding protein
MRRLIVAISTGIALWNTMAVAADVRVLSAGAVEPGLLRAAEQFERASGNAIRVQFIFNTAPQLTKRMAEGEVADILIAPPAILDDQAKNGRIAAQGRLMLGRVGVGVVVRASAANPDIATIEALNQTMLSADSIVYNTASSGLYLEKLFERIGIAEQIKAKTTRYANGEDVMYHIIKGKGNELGFGAITEIKLFEPKGLKLVGPLPPDIQNYTSYGAALMSNAPSADAAKAFLTYLASPEAKQIFIAAGIE